MNARSLFREVITPAAEPLMWQSLRGFDTLKQVQSVPEGLDGVWHSMLGRIKALQNPRVRFFKEAKRAEVVALSLEGLPDEVWFERLCELRDSIRIDPDGADGRLSELLGVVAQVCTRVLGYSPYRVQLLGALVMHSGRIAEMATGEGKTLTVALAAALSALSGRPCHVVTANDYLAARDAESMEPLFNACGISVSFITSETPVDDRPIKYQSSVVYLTAKDLLADYLRGRMSDRGSDPREMTAFMRWRRPDLNPRALRSPQLLTRGLHTVIVDEADSVLIDEAVTPLILSAPRETRGLQDAVQRVSELADALLLGFDFEAAQATRSVTLLQPAIDRLTQISAGIPGAWRAPARREELLRQALSVRQFFKAGRHYVVSEGEVVLLDEFTGRMTPGRTLTGGLHQAIEAYEGVAITEPKESIVQMSFQSFFRRFRKLGGCTGTAAESASELWRVYELQVVRVPTHRPRRVRHHPLRMTATKEQKWALVAQQVRELQAEGRPTLIGVRSVGASLELEAALQAECISSTVLNALAHEQEAEIVAQAGQISTVTIATNMAGRGTDIKLSDAVRSCGGLHVIIAEPNESRRVDRQLVGRCGRQGDPGSVSILLSQEDDLVKSFLSSPVRSSLHGLAFWPAAVQAIVHMAQRRAERLAFDRRLGVLKNDEWLESALPYLSLNRGESR